VSEEEGNRRRPRLRAVGLPAASLLVGILAAAFLVILTEPRLAAFYGLPPALLRPETKYAVLALLGLVVVSDLYRYRRRRACQMADLQRLAEQIDDLWQRNKQLRLKAHTYSDHAEKLKLFISDKLLEYIEYDEKFLHFKGIAAEVRHNGVISFDKVQTALHSAAAEAAAAGHSTADHEAALEAMRYLWDLLDLSTADNLTLHIGNLLCECEEHYCQRLLNAEHAAALPYEPVYSPRRAAWRALAMVRQETLEAPDGEAPWMLDDRRIHARLEPVGPLLGNENHLVLLLDNLLRNAQFYAGKRGYGAPFASIALSLTEDDGEACLRVYNRGPHIREEDRANLFQLGYSTRRKREHHGRGLGLYFVNEIVKGYEGHIRVDNIHTPAGRYRLHAELDNGEAIDAEVEVSTASGRPACVAAEDPDGACEWPLPAPLRRVSVMSTDGASCVLDDFSASGRQQRHDPSHPARPHWRIHYRPRRNNHRLRFEPLDINGVEFEIRLPTAASRLEGVPAESGEVGYSPLSSRSSG